MKPFLFSTVSDVHIGENSLAQLGSVLQGLGLKKILLVTDPGIEKAGLLTKAIKSMLVNNIEYCLYNQVQADPSDEIIKHAQSRYLAEKCDGVVGFGGGSSMDVAKVLAVLAMQEQELGDIYGVDNISSKRVPLVQIPTTAGTGSEATMVSVVTTGATTKSGIVSRSLLADAIILDPNLTVGLPANITAYTGIDAMVHAVESYTSARLKNPVSDMLAKEALRLLSGAIHTAVNDGTNISARNDMLLGAMFAGQAFANAPVAAVHALAYPLGGFYHIPHGLSNSLVLPQVLKFNGPAADSLYSELLPCISDIQTEKESDANAADLMASYFLKLAEDLNIPSSLREMNIPENDMEMLAEAGMQQQRLLINNPREVKYDDALAIYQAAY